MPRVGKFQCPRPVNREDADRLRIDAQRQADRDAKGISVRLRRRTWEKMKQWAPLGDVEAAVKEQGGRVYTDGLGGGQGSWEDGPAAIQNIAYRRRFFGQDNKEDV